MLRWCFKCRKSVEAEPGNCPSCGRVLGAVHDGERPGWSPTSQVIVKPSSPARDPYERRDISEIGTQIVTRLEGEGLIDVKIDASSRDFKVGEEGVEFLANIIREQLDPGIAADRGNMNVAIAAILRKHVRIDDVK